MGPPPFYQFLVPIYNKFTIAINLIQLIQKVSLDMIRQKNLAINK
ncbi:hypothetical protein [Romboutsia lituseburensis]|nr:hypothetical protein [Romboutsia lituseburensis]MCR8743946.1 hypothetical protein [Romboutsia lituseburensis]